MFNYIYSKSKAEMVTVQLLKSYCIPFVMYGVEAASLSSANIRILLRKKEQSIEYLVRVMVIVLSLEGRVLDLVI